MAKPTTTTFGEFLIYLGDAADPEVFAPFCGLTSKGLTHTANVQETSVPDCDNPDAPAYIERAVDTQSAEISGSGVMAQEAFDTLEEMRAGGVSRNLRIYPMGLSNGYYAGAFVLTSFGNQVARGQKVGVDLTWQSDGEYLWVP